MACARNIGLSNLPIVVINVDGYYEPFKQMLDRAYLDELIKLEPHQIVHFVPTAQEAVKWIESNNKANIYGLQPKLKRRESALRRSSFMDSPSIADWFRTSSRTGDEDGKPAFTLPQWVLPFVTGLAVGGAFAARALTKK